MAEVNRTYTQCDIDLSIARSVWALIDALEHTNEPPKMIGVCVEADDKDGKLKVNFTKYTPGDEEKNEHMVAALSVEPYSDLDDDRTEDDDPEMRKAMQFMYFYQAVNVTVQKFQLGLL
jgi:hypothetical protein